MFSQVPLIFTFFAIISHLDTISVIMSMI